MRFDLDELTPRDRYKLMTASITPRPIAWITTRSQAGIDNAAPYSFFNMVAADPPLVVLGLMRKPDGSYKDSAANILETGEFVVNLVRREDAQAMNLTCVDAPPEVNELELAGLTMLDCNFVRPCRIGSAPVSMECRLYQAIEPGPASTVVLGKVVALHVADGLVNDALHLDTPAMNLIARMHGAGWYTGCSDLFQLDRPSWEQDT